MLEFIMCNAEEQSSARFDDPQLNGEIYPRYGNLTLLFDGKYSDDNSPLTIRQKNREFALLEKGILLAEIYSSADNITSVVGRFSGKSLHAYSVGSLYLVNKKMPANIKDRIFDKMINDEEAITEDFKKFSDIFDYIKKVATTSYHLDNKGNNIWTGKQIYNGLKLCGSEDTGSNEREIEMHRSKK